MRTALIFGALLFVNALAQYTPPGGGASISKTANVLAGDSNGNAVSAGFTAAVVVKTSDSGTVSNTMLAGGVANNKLANSTATVGGVTCTLGGSCTPNTLHSITFVVDGGGSVIVTGDIKYYPPVNFACTINRIDISSDLSGSITVDVWKAASAIPTSGNKISASAPLTLSSAQSSLNGSLTGWTTSVSAGDVFGFSVATVATVTRVTGVIWCL